MKVTVFIYDKDNKRIIERRIKYDMLDNVLDEYQGKDTFYMVVKNAKTNDEMKGRYEEFKERLHRKLSGS